jgi:hypothetical protein
MDNQSAVPETDPEKRTSSSGSGRRGRYIVSSLDSKEARVLSLLSRAHLERLERKRKELDLRISRYIEKKQKDFDAYEQELIAKGKREDKRSRDLQDNTDDLTGSGSVAEDESHKPAKKSTDIDNLSQTRGGSPNRKLEDLIQKAEEEALTLAKPRIQRNAASFDSIRFQGTGAVLGEDTDSSGNRTPIRDREMEFTALFAPTFLPLLEAGSANRSNSAPPAPSDGLSQSVRQQDRSPLKRAETDTAIQKPKLMKKSAMKKGGRKKRVSLVIDNEIVRPSESPKQSSAPPTPTDSEADSIPNVVVTNKDGTVMHLWVPEKARRPHPDEEVLDYVMAVGGTLHESNEFLIEVTDESERAHVQQLPKQENKPFHEDAEPTSHTFNWSTPPSESVLSGNGLSAPITISSATNRLPSPSSSDTTSPAERTPTNVTSPLSPPLSTAMSPPKASRTSGSYISGFNEPGAGTVYHHQISPTSPMSPTSPPKADEIPKGLLVNAGYLDDEINGPKESFVGSIDGNTGMDEGMAGSAGYPASLGRSYMDQYATKRGMKEKEDIEDEKISDKSKNSEPPKKQPGLEKEQIFENKNVKRADKDDNEEFMGELDL